MDAWLTASIVVDRALTLLAVVTAVWLALDLLRRRPAAAPGAALDRLPWCIELAGLATILAVTAACRLLFLSSPITPAYWDATVNTVMVDQMARGPGFGATFRAILIPFQGLSYFVRIPTLLPAAAFLQSAFGPSAQVQGIIGAALALAGVALAWAMGRAYRGPVFGLIFAAFLSASITQLVWSRVGGVYLGGVPHVLAVVLCGFEAGRRRDLRYAVAGALLTWLALYNHYQARVCLPLLYVAVLAGALRGPRAIRTTLLHWTVVTAALAAALRVSDPGALASTLWPNMGGDVGNQGERTLRDLIDKNLSPTLMRLRQCVMLMLAGRQASLRTEPTWGWGLAQGGMLLTPAIGFGAVGLIVSLIHLRRDLLPLAIAALGMALAALSEAQVRKLLVFDLGWQFLAAVGLFQVLHHPLLASVRRRTILVAGGVAFACASIWSLAAIAWTTRSAARLDMPYMQFALPLFGDDFDSPRTWPVTRRWEDWLRRGYLVIFVNTDHAANNFVTYGEVAALAARRPGWFQSLHRVDRSASVEVGVLADLFGRDVPAAPVVAGAARLMGARGIVFWFERPTRWDEWLIERLVAHGARATRWPEAGGGPWGAPSAEVVLEAVRLDEGLGALAALDVSPNPPREVCLVLGPVRSWTLPTPFVNALLPAPGGEADWITVASDAVRLGSQSVRTPRRAVGAALAGDELVAIDGAGTETRLALTPALAPSASSGALRVVVPPEARIGANCATRVGDDWWMVDPWSGSVAASQPASWLPRRPWVGVADGGDGRLILASADQHIAVVRPATRTVEAEFPAHVWQSFKFHDVGSCAVVRPLGSYIASFGLGSSLLALYTNDGRLVSTVRLADLLPWTASEGVTAVDVAGDRIAFVRGLGVPMAEEYTVAVEPAGGACRRGLRLRPRVTPGP